jgi:hypothetical protein
MLTFQVLTCYLFVGELVLELIGIHVELANHLIDRLNVIFKGFFTLFDAFVP